MGLPTSLDLALDRATADDRAARVRYRRALMLMVMTLAVPGSAQLVAGNRRVGRVATRVWATVLPASPEACCWRRSGTSTPSGWSSTPPHWAISGSR
jgi:hypothetical protein